MKTPCLFGHCPFGSMGYKRIGRGTFWPMFNSSYPGGTNETESRTSDLLWPSLHIEQQWQQACECFSTTTIQTWSSLFIIITILFLKLPFLILWSHWLRARSTQTSQASAPPGALDEVWLPQVLCYNYHDNQIIRSIINQNNRSSDQLSIR